MLPKEETQSFTFYTARIAIDEQLNKLSANPLHGKEIELLFQLREKLNAFEHLQKRWTSGSGALADYYKIGLLEEITEKEKKFQMINQEQLIEESIKSIKEASEFAMIMARELTILLFNNEQILDPDLFKTLEDSMKGATKVAKAAYHHASLLTVDGISSHPIYQFATLLGGRFIYSHQEKDPILSRDRGVCYGLVMNWRNELVDTGKYLSLPRSDKTTMTEHLQQKDNTFVTLPCKSNREIWQSIDFMLSLIDTDHIYLLSYFSNRGHGMGLRKCPNGEIEFFDPNFGIFVFPNNSTFRVWCNELLSYYLRVKENFSISLTNIGDQPQHSVPTIPAFQLATSKEETYQHITHEYNQDYLRTKETYVTLKEWIQVVNEMNKIKMNLNEIQIHPNYDNTFIKNKIIAEINHEINRLENIFFGQKKIMAFKELAMRIIHADPTLTLLGTIEAWLAATPKGSTETYETIINSQRLIGSGKTSSSSFVESLITNYEINQHVMTGLQTSILNYILSVVTAIKAMNPKYSSALFQVISKVCLKNNIDTQQFIHIIKKECTTKSGLFAETTKNEDKYMLELYKLIKDLNPNDAYSLKHTALSLNTLYIEVNKDVQHALCLANRKRNEAY